MAPPEETEAAGADSNGIGGQTPTAEQKPAKRVRNSTEDGKERSAEQPLDGVSGGATSDTLLVPLPAQPPLIEQLWLLLPRSAAHSKAARLCLRQLRVQVNRAQAMQDLH